MVRFQTSSDFDNYSLRVRYYLFYNLQQVWFFT